MTDEQPRVRPWDGVGTALVKPMTAREAIRAGELDWDVQVTPACRRRRSGEYEHVAGEFWVEKADDEQVLGRVTERYVPFQNREAFEFADNLVSSGDGCYVRVGALKHNKVIFLVMAVPEEITVADCDPHDLHMILTTSHDGKKAINAYLALTRLSCTNQLTFLRRNAPHSWSIPHLADVKSKIEQAREALQLRKAYAESFVETSTKMVETPITDARLHRLLVDVLPHRPKTDEVIEAIEDLYAASSFTGTAWGALNAVTEYFDHKRDTRSPESVFFGAMNGDPARIRNACAQRLAVAA